MDLNIIKKFENILGPKGIISNRLDLQPYLIEERGKFKGNAIVLLKPSSTKEISDIVKICSKEQIPIVPQGGRTGLCGGAVPSLKGDDILISLEKLNNIRSIDTINSTLTAEAGCILSNIQKKASDNNRFFP